MKPTCDLCPREATRWYEPGDDARCGLHEYNDRASVPSGTSVPLTRRPPPPDVAACALCRGLLRPGAVVCPQCETGGYHGPVAPSVPLALPAFESTSADGRAWTLDGKATVRPPADERCPRCSRILIAAPCGCLTPVDRAIASGRAHRADMAGLSTADKLAVWRALGVAAPEATGTLGSASCTS